MNAKKFSHAMSELDTKYVDEALHYKKKAKKPRWITWGAMAACICLIAAGVFTLPLFMSNNPSTTPPVVEQETAYGFTMEGSDTLYLPISFFQRKAFGIVDENATGLTDENTYKITADDLGDVMGIVGDSREEGIVGETVYHFIKFPTDDSICIVAVRGTYEFYVKEGVKGIEGTNNLMDAPVDEDTYHEVEPNTPAEDGTAHGDMEASNGTITLEYITELQAEVSTAMSNGELPFVSSSAVYENPYRLHITVSSNAEKDVAKLKAFDTIGGALEIVYQVNPTSAESVATE